MVPRLLQILPILAWLWPVAAGAADLPTSRKNLQLRLTPVASGEPGRRQLSTVLDGHPYPIDEIVVASGVVRIFSEPKEDEPKPWLLDPNGQHLYYASLTGCGFEQEGMAIFRSDLRGQKVEPVLASCKTLEMEIAHFGKTPYLVVREGDSANGRTGFWIFHLRTLRPILHANGILKTRQGAAKYDYCQTDEEWEDDCQSVTLQMLQERSAPLRLLPRHPLTARVKPASLQLRVRANSRVCADDADSSVFSLPKPRGEVAVVEACPDEDHYEVFSGGRRGTAKRSDLEAIEVD